MAERFQKGSHRLSLPLAGSSSEDPKRVSLPGVAVTTIKRSESPQSKRVVLKELCVNTFKKLSINNKVTPSKSKSGSASPVTKASSTPHEKDHETNVEFAREFVEELVENIPAKTGTDHLLKEDTSRYSLALSDISALSESSLPDLLQPEAQYKKLVDTDTDTTDYESAADSDAVSLNASLGLDCSDIVSSPDVLDATRIIASDLTLKVLQIDTDTFEDAETSLSEALLSPGLDISALCVDVGKLCLETPKRLTGNSLEDSFLVTLRPDSAVSLNTTDGEVQAVYLGDSIVEKSLNESSVESGPLEESFGALPTPEVLTEFNLQIIPTLDFEEEKPVTTGTVDVKSPVQEPSVEETQISTVVVDPVIEAEATQEPSIVKSVNLFEKSENSNISDKEATSSPLVNHLSIQAEVSPLTEPELELTGELAPIVGDTTPEVVPLLETELQPATAYLVETECIVEKEAIPKKDSKQTGKSEVLLVVEHQLATSTAEPLSASLSESVQTEPVLESSVIQSNESVPSVLSEVSPILEPILESSVIPSNDTVPSEIAEVSPILKPVLESSVIPSNDTVPSEIAEVSPILEPVLESSVIPSNESVPSVLSEGSPIREPVLESSVIPSNDTVPSELAEVSPILESQLSTSIANSRLSSLVVEITEREPIATSIAEQSLSTSIVESTGTEIFIASSAIATGEPEVLSVTSELVNSLPAEAVATQEVPRSDPIVAPQDIVPLLPVSQLSLQSEDFPVPTPVSVVSELLPHKRPIVKSQESTDIIDPIEAVWSPTPETASHFRDSSVDKTHLADNFSLDEYVSVKQEKISPTASTVAAVQPEIFPLQREPLETTGNIIHTERSPFKVEQTLEAISHPFVNATHLRSNGPSGDAFSPIPVNSSSKLLSQCLESGDTDFIFKKPVPSTKLVNDPSLNNLLEICQRQQRELDNQHFNSDFFGDNLYDNIQADSIAAEAAKVSEDIHNASIELIDSEMDENVNPVPLDKKWLSERSGGATKLEETRSRDSPPRSKTIGAGGDGFAESLDKRNKNIMSGSIDAQTNQSEAGPEIALQDDTEIFGDSAGFDFLSAKNSTGPSDRLVRESLYTKFDPLAAPAPAPGSRHAPLPMPPKFSENTNSVPSPTVGQLISAPTTPPTPPKAPLAVTNEGPTEVTPSKNSARALVERLISLSPAGRIAHESPVKPPPPVIKPAARQTPEEMAEELLLLRELLGAEEMSYNVTLAALQEKLKNCELELLSTKLKVKSGDEREQKLLARLGERMQSQKQLAAVMGEYEKTISKLVGEKENDRACYHKEREAILKEKDVALGHLTNIEIAFSDVHQKYERCKTVVEAFKSNEDVLRESLAKYEALIHKQEQKYDMLKAHAMTQLENANQELDAVRRGQATESAKLKAMLKKSELKTSSLEEMLEQKVKENLELASICDDLIAKVGT